MSRSRRQMTVAALFIVVVIFFLLTFQVARVRGNSMLPTFSDGQFVLSSVLHGPLKKGDVVLVNKEHDVLIKRIAYLPGEVIEGRDSLRFARVREYFDRPPLPPRAGFLDKIKLKVPKGQYVILGDNPSVSDDSRAFGPVPITDIIGRVVNAPPKP